MQLESNIKRLEDEKGKLAVELERLKKHLIDVEEGYTQDILESKEREDEVQKHVENLEDELRSMKSKLLSEETEEQIQSLKAERDKASSEASVLDDKVHQHAASISKLQIVIQQIQKGIYNSMISGYYGFY